MEAVPFAISVKSLGLVKEILAFAIVVVRKETTFCLAFFFLIQKPTNGLMSTMATIAVIIINDPWSVVVGIGYSQISTAGTGGAARAAAIYSLYTEIMLLRYCYILYIYEIQYLQ